jgi:hypothetical protein
MVLAKVFHRKRPRLFESAVGYQYRRLLGRLAAIGCILLLAACAGAQKRGESLRAQKTAAEALASLSDYTQWLGGQAEAERSAERDRLEALPESAERNLRLALLFGQRNSVLYDPDRSTSLLMQMTSAESTATIDRQLAELLVSMQPHPNYSCKDSERLSKLSSELAAQLVEEERQRLDLTGRLDATHQQLETEHNERERLEKQLQALKSLEATIKGRDDASSR